MCINVISSSIDIMSRITNASKLNPKETLAHLPIFYSRKGIGSDFDNILSGSPVRLHIKDWHNNPEYRTEIVGNIKHPAYSYKYKKAVGYTGNDILIYDKDGDVIGANSERIYEIAEMPIEAFNIDFRGGKSQKEFETCMKLAQHGKWAIVLDRFVECIEANEDGEVVVGGGIHHDSYGCFLSYMVIPSTIENTTIGDEYSRYGTNVYYCPKAKYGVWIRASDSGSHSGFIVGRIGVCVETISMAERYSYRVPDLWGDFSNPKVLETFLSKGGVYTGNEETSYIKWKVYSFIPLLASTFRAPHLELTQEDINYFKNGDIHFADSIEGAIKFCELVKEKRIF
jgi:hypothetical protein